MKNQQSQFTEVYSKDVLSLEECMSVCISCSKKCLEEGHKTTAALCAECADFCNLTIKAICGHYEFKNEIRELCALVCQKCSNECNKMQAEHCKECASVCDHCSEACV